MWREHLDSYEFRARVATTEDTLVTYYETLNGKELLATRLIADWEERPVYHICGCTDGMCQVCSVEKGIPNYEVEDA